MKWKAKPFFPFSAWKNCFRMLAVILVSDFCYIPIEPKKKKKRGGGGGGEGGGGAGNTLKLAGGFTGQNVTALISWTSGYADMCRY